MNKVNLKTDVTNINHFEYETAHGTTNKFFEPTVPFIMEVTKNTKNKIKTSIVRRVQPLPLPTMSTIKFHTRYFWVPFIDICPYFLEFDERTPYAFRYRTGDTNFTSKIPTKVPYITTRTIVELFFSNLKVHEDTLHNTLAYGDPLGEYASNNYVEPVAYDPLLDIPHDFKIKSSLTGYESVVLRYKLTSRGRIAYKLLRSLGYDFYLTNCAVNADGFSVDKDLYNDELSALPLLAFLKVILNYYENAAFVNNTTRLAEMSALLHIDVDAYALTVSDLDKIIDFACYMTYPKDYFTTSFVNPIGGNNMLVNNENYVIGDNTTEQTNAIVTSNSTGTPTFAQYNQNNYISAMGIKLLQRLTNYLRKHQIAGGRTVERALAEYGININDSISRRTSYIDSIITNCNITPVVNTTDEQLGDYAGFGSSMTEKDKNPVITINSGDCGGYIIAIDTIAPEIFYNQGIKKHVRHVTKFDFLTPKFDAVSVQAIEVAELMCTKDATKEYHNSLSPFALRFGNKPRYAEYKEMTPIITGDFICNSINLDIDSFFTYRQLLEDNYLDDDNRIMLTQSRVFSSTYDSQQFARIFYINENRTDYIYSLFRYSIEQESAMKKLYDEFEMKEDEGSHEVTLEPGGSNF